MKTSIQPQKVKQSWSIKEIQEAATKMASHKIVSRIHFLEKNHNKEIDEMEKASAHLNSEKLQQSGIKTPLQLVTYLAEFEVNMFGSEASISGDDDRAVLTSEQSPVWLEATRSENFAKDQVEQMHEHYSSWMKHLGHKFGFKVHVEIAKDDLGATVTFTKK